VATEKVDVANAQAMSVLLTAASVATATSLSIALVHQKKTGAQTANDVRRGAANENPVDETANGKVVRERHAIQNDPGANECREKTDARRLVVMTEIGGTDLVAAVWVAEKTCGRDPESLPIKGDCTVISSVDTSSVCIQEEEGEKKTKIKKPFKATGKIENMYKKKHRGQGEFTPSQRTPIHSTDTLLLLIIGRGQEHLDFSYITLQVVFLPFDASISLLPVCYSRFCIEYWHFHGVFVLWGRKGRFSLPSLSSLFPARNTLKR